MIAVRDDIEMVEVTLHPYYHDCPKCRFLGWLYPTFRWGNMYVCEGIDHSSFLIRWSSKLEDYSSWPTNLFNGIEGPHSISVTKPADGEYNELGEARMYIQELAKALADCMQHVPLDNISVRLRWRAWRDVLLGEKFKGASGIEVNMAQVTDRESGGNGHE